MTASDNAKSVGDLCDELGMRESILFDIECHRKSGRNSVLCHCC